MLPYPTALSEQGKSRLIYDSLVVKIVRRGLYLLYCGELLILVSLDLIRFLYFDGITSVEKSLAV